MESLNIDLPTTLHGYIDTQVIEGGYGSVSEHLRDLIEADQRRKAEEHVDSLLITGLDSGLTEPIPPDFWQARRQKLSDQRGGAMLVAIPNDPLPLDSK